MSDTTTPGLLWIALVTTIGDPVNPGQELVATDYARFPVPLPDVNGNIPNLLIAGKKDWPPVLGYELWDDPEVGNYVYGGVRLNWPLGPGGGIKLLFGADGIPREPDPVTGL